MHYRKKKKAFEVLKARGKGDKKLVRQKKNSTVRKHTEKSTRREIAYNHAKCYNCVKHLFNIFKYLAYYYYTYYITILAYYYFFTNSSSLTFVLLGNMSTVLEMINLNEVQLLLRHQISGFMFLSPANVVP